MSPSGNNTLLARSSVALGSCLGALVPVAVVAVQLGAQLTPTWYPIGAQLEHIWHPSGPWQPNLAPKCTFRQHRHELLALRRTLLDDRRFVHL